MSKPNVLLITIDTLRADRLGCYGCPRPLTPNLDRLAASGIRFEQAITGGSWTQAAFPVLLTSTHASMYGGCLGPLSMERPSPIDSLSRGGYTTGAFVTSPLLGKAYGYQRGFDYFFEILPREKDPTLRKLKGGQYLLRQPLTHNISNLFGLSSRPARLYVSAEEVNKAIIPWLEDIDEPFFCWVHYMDVHWPYQLEERLTKSPEIAQAWRDLAHMHSLNWEGATISSTQYEHYRNLYEQAIQYTDQHVGALLSYLDRSGLDNNTIVVIVSDHGEEFMERGHWGHVETNLYDQIIRVPLILRLPGHPDDRTIRRQVSTLDIMPTILNLCECEPPPGMIGADMAPLWKGDEPSFDESVAISERWRNVGDLSHIIAVRNNDFKYIYNVRQPDSPQLYDLVSDPGETLNVSSRYPDIVRELQTHVEDILHQAESIWNEDPSNVPEHDLETIKRLRDLGYIE